MIPFKTGYRIADEIELFNRIRQHDTDIDRLWRLQRQQSYGWPIGGKLGVIPPDEPSSNSTSSSSSTSKSSDSGSSGSGSGSGSVPPTSASGSVASSSSSGSLSIACPTTSTVNVTHAGTTHSIPFVSAGRWQLSFAVFGGFTTITVTCDIGILTVGYVTPFDSFSGSSPSVNGTTFDLHNFSGDPFTITVSW